MKTQKEKFLDGFIAIHVTNEEQSKYLIDLAEKCGFPKEDGSPSFEIDTYKKYPYYYIEDDCQLQANESYESMLDIFCGDKSSIEEFNDKLLKLNKTMPKLYYGKYDLRNNNLDIREYNIQKETREVYITDISSSLFFRKYYKDKVTKQRDSLLHYSYLEVFVVNSDSPANEIKELITEYLYGKTNVLQEEETER